jgi:hypothetical protein
MKFQDKWLHVRALPVMEDFNYKHMLHQQFYQKKKTKAFRKKNNQRKKIVQRHVP